jgi:cytoskeletal protein CcmA (bactofilin family)
MWNERKPNSLQTMAPEPKNSLTEKQSLDTMRLGDSKTDRRSAWLGPSLHVKGDITGAEDLLIDGSIEGMIQLDERKLTVGTAAKLKADVSAGEVLVYGCVKGNVRATGKIEIKKDGSVIGNLTTAQIMIEEGADFKGSIEIDRSAAKGDDNNTLARAASAGAGALKAASDTQDTWTPPPERPN